MAKIKRKGTSGNAREYITRTQAVKKLQVSLADFRRLCIFKGVYPREPKNKKKANKGSTANVTFYYYKDIKYLMHEPVLDKFRDHKTFSKKLQRALGRGDVSDANRLELNRPKYTLDHVIKERYPTFLDALRDLDDPLNMLFLFANMPATDTVSHRVTKEAERLANQWLAIVSKERLLKKVFVSIKGVYYQATVKGQEVRWLVPFKFPSLIPSDVDFRIMLTFLEFYSTLLNFVLFRLYHDANLIYPPTIDITKLKSVGGLSSYVLRDQNQANALLPKEKQENGEEQEGTHLSDSEITKALDADKEDEEEVVEEENVEDVVLDEFTSNNKTTGDLLSQPSKYASPTSVLFSKFVFFVGREVPLDILEFCILSAGGSLISEVALDELKINSPEAYAKLDFSNITHQVVDRPKLASKVDGRTYIQPQWVFDCLNKSELLPVSQYAPGETLPPHLSPWGDAGTYDPEAALEEVEEEDEEAEDVEDIEVAEEDVDQEEDEEDEDIEAQKELEKEAAGVKFSEAEAKTKKLKSKKRVSEEEEHNEIKKTMLSNKQRRLYDSIKNQNAKLNSRQNELTKKRRKIEKTKAELKKLSK